MPGSERDVMTLREAMRQFLRDWRDDLSAEWRDLLAATDPVFDAVDAQLKFDPAEPIYPGRRGRPVAGAPSGAHTFRTLDGLSPRDVRAVIVGQDPYPRIAQATGRSFEQGDLADWTEDQAKIADSLQRIVQVLLVARTGNAAYGGPDANWRNVMRDRRAGALSLDAPAQLFERLQAQGVLFLNASLTITHFEPGGAPEQLRGHIPLWRPVIDGILRALATRPTGHVVFMLWGGPARAVFRNGKIRQAAEAAGTWEKRVGAVEHAHPNARPAGRPFYDPPNPFSAADAMLTRMGGEPLRW